MDEDKFCRNIEKLVKKTIVDYSLIEKKDRIVVACSGGKDSTAVLYILKKLGYRPEAITVDAQIGNYTKQNLINLKKFCKEMKVKLHIISFRKEFGYSLCYIRSVLNSKGFDIKSCTICGVLRRRLLNKYAKKLRFTKIATGHNKDDEVQAVIMNIFKNELDLAARLGPKTGIINDKQFVTRIKPLYFVSEEDVAKYSKLHNFPVKYEACPCRSGSYRHFMRQRLAELEKDNPKIKDTIIKNFLKSLPKLRKEYSKGAVINTCPICKEPSKEGVCTACKIMEKLK